MRQRNYFQKGIYYVAIEDTEAKKVFLNLILPTIKKNSDEMNEDDSDCP